MSTAFGSTHVTIAARSAAPLLGCGVVMLGCWLVTGGLALNQRFVLTIYSGAAAAWCLGLSEEWIAGALAVAALLFLDLIAARDVATSATQDLVWLLVGAYLIAFAIHQSRLVAALGHFAFRRPMPAASLAYRTAAIVAATAFIFPSTSARAAMLLPLQRLLSDVSGDVRIERTFALLIPTIILLSAGGVLTGAAAHIVAIEVVERSGSARIGYGEWLIAAMPIALASSVAATWLIVRLILPRNQRGQIVGAPLAARPRMGRVHAAMLAVMAATIVLWATRDWHGISFGAVGMTAALCLLALGSKHQQPAVRDMASAIDWKLILLLVSTVVLAEALVSSGAANTVGAGLMAAIPEAVLASNAATIALIAAVSMLAHVVIPSRSARAAVLITSIAIPLSVTGFDIVPLVFLIALGTGFCQLTPYGAKPLLIFASGTDTAGFRRDLLRLGAPLFVITWLILVGLALTLWPLIGLSSNLAGNELEWPAFTP